MAFEIAKTWKNKESVIYITLPLNRISSLASIPSRQTIRLSEATQQQMGLLHTLGHPAITEVKDEKKKN